MVLIDFAPPLLASDYTGWVSRLFVFGGLNAVRLGVGG
jgi:hypothetical protein